MHRARLPILLLALGLAACRKVEPRSRASYLVRNGGDATVHLWAQQRSGAVALRVDSIAAGATAEILEVVEGSGGHVYPSNFLTDLRITARDSSGAEVEVYRGVRNGDWVRMDSRGDWTGLLLELE
jgi:hypothetical protein